MLFVFIIAGAILTAIVFQKVDFSFLGAFLGFIVWRMNKLSSEIVQLRQTLHDLAGRRQSDASQTPSVQTVSMAVSDASIQNATVNSPSSEPETETDVLHRSDTSQSQSAVIEVVNPQSGSPAQQVEQTQQTTFPTSNFFDKAILFVKDYFTQGNVVVRVGAVILFFGVAFLLKYAAENSSISMETRLISVAVAAIVLLVFGWRLKDKNQGYGLILQGTAVGILYITLFVSFRLYSLLPAGFVFSMLFIFSGLAMALAILQNSHSLAVLSATGGFLAPVLTSTGAGSHVALFSYYAILNLGIFGVAWYRSWRLLNLIGFAFTFIIGSAWGVMRYQPADFATTEPFLILFFLLYSAIALLFATKQKPLLKGYVDSSLVFGLPIISFSLQVAMVRSFEFGLAWSAFALGGFYLASAFMVLRGKNSHLKIIAEAYLALGIIFTSLVIPLALDGEWTSAAWAIEGGGLVWLGLRQSRWFPKYFGALIQFAGGVLFLSELKRNGFDSALFGSDLLGIILVALAALFSSYQIWKRRESLPVYEARSYLLFLIWGLMWWYFGGFAEIEQHFSGPVSAINALLLFISLSGLLAYRVEIINSWFSLRIINWLTFISLFMVGLFYFMAPFHQARFFNSWVGLFWLFALVSFYWSLYHRERPIALINDRQRNRTELRPWLHLAALLSLITFSIVVTKSGFRFMGFNHSSWSISLYAILAAIWMLLLSKTDKWPINLYQQTYAVTGQRVILVGAVLWSVMVNFPDVGIAQPLTYIPLLNPLDIAQGILLILTIYVIRQTDVLNIKAHALWLKMTLIVFVFAWLNVILLRSIHAWVHIPYRLDRLLESNLVQTSLSIFWTILGLAGTIYASRVQSRRIWIYAAGLIGVVVAKLFFIDLDNSSSIERIVSFLVVGILLLVVGYFSPLPAKEGMQNDQ